MKFDNFPRAIMLLIAGTLVMALIFTMVTLFQKQDFAASLDEQKVQAIITVAIRNVDFVALLTREYEQFCKDNGFTEESGFVEHKDWEPIVASSTEVTYGDVTGDGNEEASVMARSCVSGTGGPDILRVYTMNATGTPVELTVGDNNLQFQGKDYGIGFGGHMHFRIMKGKFIEEWPLYQKGDANCCPSGGMRSAEFQWNGIKLVIQRIYDTPVVGSMTAP